MKSKQLAIFIETGQYTYCAENDVHRGKQNHELQSPFNAWLAGKWVLITLWEWTSYRNPRKPFVHVIKSLSMTMVQAHVWIPIEAPRVLTDHQGLLPLGHNLPLKQRTGLQTNSQLQLQNGQAFSLHSLHGSAAISHPSICTATRNTANFHSVNRWKYL